MRVPIVEIEDWSGDDSFMLSKTERWVSGVSTFHGPLHFHKIATICSDNAKKTNDREDDCPMCPPAGSSK